MTSGYFSLDPQPVKSLHFFSVHSGMNSFLSEVERNCSIGCHVNIDFSYVILP